MKAATLLVLSVLCVAVGASLPSNDAGYLRPEILDTERFQQEFRFRAEGDEGDRLYEIIHLLHEFHIAIDSPHMYHQAAHKVEHLMAKHPKLQAAMKDISSLASKSGQTAGSFLKEVAARFKGLKAVFPKLKEAINTQAIKTSLTSSISKLQNAIPKIKGARTKQRALRQLSNLRAELAASANVFIKAEKYIRLYFQHFKIAMVASGTQAASILKLVPRGGKALADGIRKATQVLKTNSPKLISLARTAASAGGRLLSFITSEKFGKAVIVVAAILEGYHGYKNSHAATTTGKVANGITSGLAGALTMANPWVALVDLALDFAGEPWSGFKPSTTFKCTGAALVSIGEAVITGDDKMMRAVDADMKSGKCGYLLQFANAAGEYIASGQLAKDVVEAWDVISDQVEKWNVATMKTISAIMSGAHKHAVRITDPIRAFVGDVREKAIVNYPVPNGPVTYLKIISCTGLSGGSVGVNSNKPYFECTARSKGKVQKKSTDIGHKVNGAWAWDHQPGQPTKSGFGMAFRNTDPATTSVYCKGRVSVRLWVDSDLKQSFTTLFFPKEKKAINPKNPEPFEVSISNGGKCKLMFVRRT